MAKQKASAKNIINNQLIFDFESMSVESFTKPEKTVKVEKEIKKPEKKIKVEEKPIKKKAVYRQQKLAVKFGHKKKSRTRKAPNRIVHVLKKVK